MPPLILFFFQSTLRKKEDDLHLNVYDDDVAGRDAIGKASIDLKKQTLNEGRFDDWIKLPAMLGFRSKGEIHVIMEYHVIYLSFVLPLQIYL